MSIDRAEGKPQISPVVVVGATAAWANWIALSGYLDAFNRDQLDDALASITLAGALPVYLDLTRLAFCDARGAGVLLDFVARAEREGHQVHTYGARPVVRKLGRLISNGRADVPGPLDPPPVGLP